MAGCVRTGVVSGMRYGESRSVDGGGGVGMGLIC